MGLEDSSFDKSKIKVKTFIWLCYAQILILWIATKIRYAHFLAMTKWGRFALNDEILQIHTYFAIDSQRDSPKNYPINF